MLVAIIARTDDGIAGDDDDDDGLVAYVDDSVANIGILCGLKSRRLFLVCSVHTSVLANEKFCW